MRWIPGAEMPEDIKEFLSEETYGKFDSHIPLQKGVNETYVRRIDGNHWSSPEYSLASWTR